ncbi:MAG TPA: sigma-70 family RNA polymerase sigma factor [Anaerolineales bacterium]|nr:sigma-70 family RNA polymerase sigma factor [Anaerolineales bacterium]
MLDPKDEAALVARAKQDAEAFGLLYERYVKKIYNYVYYRTGNEHDAEDLTARVFVRAMAHLHHYDDRGLPFSAWLYRIAHNLLANWHRDQGRRKVFPLDQLPVHDWRDLRSEAPEAMTESREERERLLRAIRQLPGERQQLLILKFVERLSNAEIGAILQRSEGAVKSLYHRTLLSLRDELARGGARDEA